MWYKAYQDGEPYPGAVGVTKLHKSETSVWRGWLSGYVTIFAENLPDSQKASQNLRLHPARQNKNILIQSTGFSVVNATLHYSNQEYLCSPSHTGVKGPCSQESQSRPLTSIYVPGACVHPHP